METLEREVAHLKMRKQRYFQIAAGAKTANDVSGEPDSATLAENHRAFNAYLVASRQLRALQDRLDQMREELLV